MQHKNSGFVELSYIILLFVTFIVFISNIYTVNLGANLKYNVRTYILDFKDLFVNKIPQNYFFIKENSRIIQELQNDNTNLHREISLLENYKIMYMQLNKVYQDLQYTIKLSTDLKINTFITTQGYVNSIHYPTYDVWIKIKDKNEVQENMLVISSLGIIGYVDAISGNTANIITTANPKFKISAISEKTKINLIIYGNSTLNPDIVIYDRNQNLIEGEEIYTSGLEGYFTSGIKIGTVVIRNDDYVVQLYENLNQLQYVHLIK